VHDDGDPVVGNGQLDVVDSGLLAGLDLARLDGARRTGDGDLAVAELLEAMVTRAPLSFWNSSATASVMG
jgi:hypothetical protein